MKGTNKYEHESNVAYAASAEAWLISAGPSKGHSIFQAVGANAVTEGTVFAVKVTTPDGKVLESNIKLTANDIETINMMKNANNQ